MLSGPLIGILVGPLFELSDTDRSCRGAAGSIKKQRESDVVPSRSTG
jgi:hypothetical protein